MTTQNDLITTASNLTTAKKPAAAAAAKAAQAAESESELLGTEPTSSWSSTAVAPSTSSADVAAAGTIAASQSAQIGLTTQATTEQTEAQTAAAAEAQASVTAKAAATQSAATTTTQAALTTKAAAAVASSETAAEAALISTIYPASTETDVHNSIERLPERSGKMATAMHPGVADSLTKGFSIPTFLPPFPVFAAADLPAYRAAADAAEAAKLAAEAAAAEAARKTAAAASSEAVTMSPEEQRRQNFNEQHSYLAAHREAAEGAGTALRRNLTMPVLNITAQMGNHAYMPCQIHRLSDKPVSWVRMRDNHIISVDETTFIADERFQSIFQEDHDYTWSLQIKYVEPGDAGWYECQMATEPKLSAKVHLQIVKPKTELIGDQSRFVKAGSKVALHCIVRGTLDPPKYIIWFRGKKKISESDERSGWYTQLDRNIFGTVGDNQNTIGSLIIPVVRKEDSGNYTCQPSNSVSVSVDLHVLSGEYSASAIMSTAPRTTAGGRSTFLSTLALLGILGLLWAVQGHTMHTPPSQT
ncbi:la-related protein 1 isoform X2 [Drosophila ficusphila]|nr:la-related protein 1 isoform X2 [Drosophila ficusphila]XP_017041188.1 la-related protein 1 isoform X2 [Drosophila ficusphila]